MTAEVIATEHGNVLVLPDECALPLGSVEIYFAGSDTLLVTPKALRSSHLIEGYFDGPYEDNGLVAPVDYPPEPVPSF